MTQAPFFIIGCARTGTTLLRTMLNQHHQIAIPVESLFIIDYLRAQSHLPLPQLIRLILGEYELSEWELDVTPDDLKDCDHLAAVFERLHELYVAQNSKQIWGQKTPRFIRYGDLLKAHYPQAQFIHLIRDPRAVANSLRQSNVHRSNIYFGARRWLKDVSHGRQIQQAYPDDTLDIYYEKLIEDPEATLRIVCEFIGIEYDEQMLAYHQHEFGEYQGYHGQIHERLNQPPTRNRIDGWRKRLTPREIALVEHICMPLMEELGYQPDNLDVDMPAGYIQRLKLQRATVGITRQVMQYFNGRTYHLFYSMWRKYKLGLLLKDVSQVNS